MVIAAIVHEGLLGGPAVVPIFVSAGTALLPAIIAGVTSVLAVLLSPRAMWGFAKRRPLVVVGLVGIAGAGWMGASYVIAATGGAGVAKGTDWSAVGREIIQRKAHAVVGVEHVWKLTDAELGDAGWPMATPLVMGERVIVATTTQYLGGMGGTLYGVEARTGKILWRTMDEAEGVPLKAICSSPAATADGKYFVIGQGLHADANSALLGVEAETGKVVWRAATPLHVESSPVVYMFGSRELAVVGVGAIEGDDRKPTGKTEWHAGYVLCVDAKLGKEEWRHKLADPESSPAVDREGIVYIGSGLNGNAVVALRSESDGVLKEKNLPREVWRTATTYPAVGSVVLAESGEKKLVLIGTGNGDFVFSDVNPAGVILAMDQKTGVEVWRCAMPETVMGPLAIFEGTVYAGCKNGEVWAMGLADGKVLWRGKVGDAKAVSPVLTGIGTDGYGVYGVDAGEMLAGFDARTGEKRFGMPLGDVAKAKLGMTMATPVLAGDMLIVATETGGVRGLRIKRGGTAAEGGAK